MSDGIKIDPNAFYHDGDLRLLLDLPESTLTSARRRGELLFTRKGKRLLYRGQWVIDWLNALTPAREVSRAF